MISMSELRPTGARFRPVKPVLVGIAIVMELLTCGVADARHASHKKAPEAAEAKANTSEMFLGGNQDWKVEIWKSPSGHRYCQATSQPVTWEKSSFHFEISLSPSISLKLISESPLPKADHVKLAFSDGSTFSLKSSKKTKGSANTVEINPGDDIFTSMLADMVQADGVALLGDKVFFLPLEDFAPVAASIQDCQKRLARS